MIKLAIWEAVRAVPKEAQKEIKGGRLKGMTDISPIWRIKLLSELFGPVGFGWYTKTVDKRIERSGDEVSAFVDIELYIKYKDEWSQPITGTGGASFVSKERNGFHMSDECFKMAETDAISVACKKLGIGADIYWQKDTTKYRPRYMEPTGIDCNELITVGNKKGYSASSIEKALIKDYGYGMEFISQEEHDATLKKLEALPDK